MLMDKFVILIGRDDEDVIEKKKKFIFRADKDSRVQQIIENTKNLNYDIASMLKD